MLLGARKQIPYENCQKGSQKRKKERIIYQINEKHTKFSIGCR